MLERYLPNLARTRSPLDRFGRGRPLLVLLTFVGALPALAAPPAAGPSGCRKWTVWRDPRHPERPGRYELVPENCVPSPAPGSGPAAVRGNPGPAPPATHAGEKLLLHFGQEGGVLLLATALADGVPGDIVRFRSTLPGTLGSAVLWGRLEAGGRAELLAGGDASRLRSGRAPAGGGW